jgi:serine/threonine-protein kinase
MIGVVLAEKFRVERLLGEGGYGVVYAGTHLGLAEPIAVKFLKVESTGAEQFAREARILFSLAHPAIVRMYDVGEVQRGMARVPWVVLELLSGPTLEEELVTRRAQGRHFTVQELQRLFLPILDGLAFAHGRGIAHRDIKPANIVLSRPSPGREEPKLLDFGTARSQAAAFQTSAGHTGFTPLYAAPEQWDPTISQPGAATDVYAMGLTMLECASLQRAFAGADNVGALMRAVMSGTGRPSLMSARPDLPPALHAVIERATAVNPQARFRDAGELRVATEQALSGMAASGGLGGGASAGEPRSKHGAAGVCGEHDQRAVRGVAAHVRAAHAGAAHASAGGRKKWGGHCGAGGVAGGAAAGGGRCGACGRGLRAVVQRGEAERGGRGLHAARGGGAFASHGAAQGRVRHGERGQGDASAPHGGGRVLAEDAALERRAHGGPDGASP